MRRELAITRLGSQGDGVAETEAGPVYVPFALPGEVVIAEIDGDRGRIIESLQRAPDRTAPACRHFGVCGGCALQHLEWNRYLDWKTRRVAEALAREGVDAPIEPIRAFGPRSRRRAAFTALKSRGAVILGFRRAQSHEVIDLAECPVLLPKLDAVISGLREVLGRLLPNGEAQILVTSCGNGLDVDISGAEGRLFALTLALARDVQALGIIRITNEKELIFSIAAPKLSFAGIELDLPAGAFLQASAEAEAAMADIALAAIGKARKVADLFCGLGAFTFALARKAAVTAVEIDRVLLAALDAGARRAQGLKPIKTLARDLMREPLTPNELKPFNAVLFDPPRAGALAQAKALAKSAVPKIVAVSCNPASFARDARALIDGGYRLERVVPIDQFVWSAHVELVAVFTRS